MDHTGHGRELEAENVNIADWYGAGKFSSLMETLHLVRSNPAVHEFS